LSDLERSASAAKPCTATYAPQPSQNEVGHRDWRRDSRFCACPVTCGNRGARWTGQQPPAAPLPPGGCRRSGRYPSTARPPTPMSRIGHGGCRPGERLIGVEPNGCTSATSSRGERRHRPKPWRDNTFHVTGAKELRRICGVVPPQTVGLTEKGPTPLRRGRRSRGSTSPADRHSGGGVIGVDDRCAATEPAAEQARAHRNRPGRGAPRAHVDPKPRPQHPATPARRLRPRQIRRSTTTVPYSLDRRAARTPPPVI
jgi:hypothetical protein